MDLSKEQMDEIVAKVDFAKGDGLTPVVVVHHETNEVLMVAYMNEESLRHTLETDLGTYWSRSREELWVKGLTSGHVQHVKWIRLDCDGDCLLLGVDQIGPACHTNCWTCFFRELRNGQWEAIMEPMSPED
jgi:phosphoribosyl-AMP cyclohydrolase